MAERRVFSKAVVHSGRWVHQHPQADRADGAGDEQIVSVFGGAGVLDRVPQRGLCPAALVAEQPDQVRPIQAHGIPGRERSTALGGEQDLCPWGTKWQPAGNPV